ncbi:unnamed protein product [Symbiodinium necroappetens]|uniref:Uncharacterized protein n=1 Tax=Symbiodinium necroappetens TaxID=1628268 RepID=A0A812ZJN2_9DINO|nr:unnamed protein product [Symbiodinium necroappetens]
MHPRNAAFARAAIGRTTFRIFARCDGFAKLFRREGAGGFQAVNVTGGTAPMSAMNPMGMMGKGGFGPMIAGGRVFNRLPLHVSLQLLVKT